MIPALLYYIALFVQVDLEAAKYGLSGLPGEQLPRFRSVMGRGWSFLLPLLVLVYTLMFAGWQAGKAAMAAVITTLLLGVFQSANRLNLRKLLTALEGTGRVLLDIVVITAVAGFVIGVLQLSGLGFRFSFLLVSMAGGNALLLLMLTAIACIVLGMGMPTSVIYIMLAVLVGPALVQLGIAPLGAHLFLLYFGILSMITPPVGLATYAAAAIGRADYLKTGWAGVRLGIVAYVVPFIFAFHPALLMTGTVVDITLAVTTSVIGVVLLGVACAGFLFHALGWAARGGAALAGLFLFPPPSGGVWVAGNVVGLALGVLLVLWNRNGARLSAAREIP